MIIVVTGSVGVGKTFFSKILAEKLGSELLHLNDFASKYKLEEKPEIGTFDFDIDPLLEEVEKIIKKTNDNLVLESHFSHFIDPELVDYLIVINRDLKELKNTYKERGYNRKKIKDNLEVESFNLCFYEAEEEGYPEEKFIVLENNGEIGKIVDEALKKIKK